MSLLDHDGQTLDASCSLQELGIADGVTLKASLQPQLLNRLDSSMHGQLNTRPIHVTGYAFAALLADGSLVCWGDPSRGSSTIQDQLQSLPSSDEKGEET